MAFGSDGSFNDVVNIDYQSGVKTVGTTEVLVAAGGSNLDDRQEVIIYNDSKAIVYLGPTGVATSGSSKGIPIEPKETLNIQVGPSISMYLIAATASNSIIVQEFS